MDDVQRMCPDKQKTRDLNSFPQLPPHYPDVPVSPSQLPPPPCWSLSLNLCVSSGIRPMFRWPGPGIPPCDSPQLRRLYSPVTHFPSSCVFHGGPSDPPPALPGAVCPAPLLHSSTSGLAELSLGSVMTSHTFILPAVCLGAP